MSSLSRVENKLQNYDFEEFDKEILSGNSDDTLMVVNFWATWCGPCIRELPYFEEINRQTLTKPVRVILVSLDFENQYHQKLIPFIEKEKLQSELIWLDANMNTERINRVYPGWSGAIPATLFIKNGKILNFKEKELSLEELQNTINSLL
jgi:thiol-disulfide isomerase/thioredoxin